MGPRTKLYVDSQLCRGKGRTFVSLFHTLMGPNIFTVILSVSLLAHTEIWKQQQPSLTLE